MASLMTLDEVHEFVEASLDCMRDIITQAGGEN